MTRIFLAVIAAGIILIVVAVLFLGAFPPKPAEHHVEHTVPNEQFKGQ